MAPPIKTGRTAADRSTYNHHSHNDTVIIVFDLPFMADDNPAHETFELSWVARVGGGNLSRKRTTTEPVDDTTLRSWTGDLMASGHVAIRFEGLKPGIYKLTRGDGREEPEVIFANVPVENATLPAPLTGPVTDRRDPEDHKYFTWLDKYVEATDSDLKSTPPDVTTLPVPEPRKAK